MNLNEMINERMSATAEKIITDIKSHIESRTGKFNEWYIGITSNAQERLFNPSEHNVSRDKGVWIYRTADSIEDAETIVKHFIDMGLKGNPKAPDDKSKMVYAFKITTDTRQQ